jgi:GBP family porin
MDLEMKSFRCAAALTLIATTGLVHAQSSVTLYGQVDLGVQYEKAPPGDVSKLVSGGRSASRLGFRGTEDLGGGLASVFVLEMGMNADTGTIAQGGRGFGRQAFVGLTSPWGTLAAGRVATFGSGTGAFDMVGPVDPFSTAWGIAGMGSTMSTATGLRVDNTVLYQSPDWAGFQAGVLHSLNAVASETSPHGANVYLTGLGARYTTGPFYAFVSYEDANNPAGGKDETHLQVGATYDFGVARVHGAYARERGLFSTDLNISGTKNGAGAEAWMVGLSVPVGAGIIRTSYQKRDGDEVGGENRDIRVAALGYEYFLSKRTSLYAVIADEKGTGTLANNPSYNKRDYTVGVLHKF